jgi:hypothetical protein
MTRRNGPALHSRAADLEDMCGNIAAVDTKRRNMYDPKRSNENATIDPESVLNHR